MHPSAESSKLKTINGQMLIEAMIAITILIVAIFSIFNLIARAISLNRVVSEQYTATYLASEGIEVVKNMIDQNIQQCKAWNQDITDGAHEVQYDSAALGGVSGDPLKFDSTRGIYSYQSGDPSVYYRTVVISTSGDQNQEIQVVSSVRWKGRSGSDTQIDVEDHLYNWRPAPAACSN
jgi:type II secretory pathway pseudopilin PulG